jgi:hypothetical protein
MNSSPRRGADPPGDREVDARSGWAEKAPMGACGAVAQDGIGADGQQGRRKATLPGEKSMTDRVDPAMNAVNASAADASVDRPPIEPQPAQLAAADDAVLPIRERRNRAVGQRHVDLFITVMKNVPLALHPAEFEAAGHAGGERTSRGTQTLVTRDAPGRGRSSPRARLAEDARVRARAPSRGRSSRPAAPTSRAQRRRRR